MPLLPELDMTCKAERSKSCNHLRGYRYNIKVVCVCVWGGGGEQGGGLVVAVYVRFTTDKVNLILISPKRRTI